MTKAKPTQGQPQYAMTARQSVNAKTDNHRAIPWSMVETTGHTPPPWVHKSRKTSGAPSVKRMLKDLTEEAAASENGIVLSAETFPRVSVKPKLRKYVKALAEALGEDSRVICYIQRPDLHVSSWYNQRIKAGRMPVARLADDVEAYIGGPHVDYVRALEPWFSEFDGRVDLINFRKLEGSVVEDFCGRIGAPSMYEASLDRRQNERIPSYLVELFRRQLAVRIDKTAHGRLRTLIRQSDFPSVNDVFGAEIDFLGSHARERIFEAFGPINQELGKLAGQPSGFFDDLDQILAKDKTMISDTEAFEFAWPAVAAQWAVRDRRGA